MRALKFKHIVLFGTALMAASVMSCSKGSSSTNNPAAVSTSTATTGTTTVAAWTSGQTVDFAPTSFTTMNDYVGTHPLNDPSGFKINIKLTQVPGQLLFGGTVKIGYNDAGSWYEGIFDTGTGTNVKCTACNDNGAFEAKFNYFYNAAGKKVFTGFFQDKYGGIALVLEPSVGSGDGDGGVYKGSVYFHNFTQSLATQSPYRKCWFITAGPYSCTSTAVMNKISYSALDNYTLLGTFTGIDLIKIQN